MSHVFDTTSDCSAAVNSLIELGYDTAIRYYSRLSWKRLSQQEAITLGRNGIKLCIVYQNRQNQTGDFSFANGEAAAGDANDYAQNVIYQPTGSAIYFAVDFDANETQIRQNVVPYFQAIQQGLAGRYRVGVYGSGRVCRILSGESLADLTWLAQARAWGEYQDWLDAGRWHLKQNMPGEVAGLPSDIDETNPAFPDFGAFLLDPESLGDAAPPLEPARAPGTFKVIARDGLRLRAGPSVQFDVRAVLPQGTTLTILSQTDDWALVDTHGDGAADGYCYVGFLRPI
jgi:hypothetical protein